MITETAFQNVEKFGNDICGEYAKENNDEMEKDFEKFYKRHYDLLAKYVFRQVQDADVMEDIVQDVFCLAYENWKTVSVHPYPEGWLLQTAKYKLLEYWRKIERRTVISIEEEELEPCRDDENYGMVEIEAVAEANLKMEEWNLMKSYYLEDKNVSVLAAQAGVADTCMRMRISRVTKKMRDILREREQGDKDRHE